MNGTILLVRHGLAVDAGVPGAATDFDRFLSDEGKGVMRLEGRALKILGVHAAAILASPLKRAQETAHILRHELGYGGPVESRQELGPDSEIEAMMAVCADPPTSPVLVVGHAPSLEKLATHILIGSPVRTAVHLKAGGVACLSFSNRLKAGSATMEWLLTPEQLIEIAASPGVK